jgi:hypothetical protein
MYFQCGWGVKAEDGFSEPQRDWADVPQNLLGEGFMNEDTARALFHGHNGWNKLMTIYGSRKLTVGSDKLPALSGLAQRYEACSTMCMLLGYR